VSNCWDTLKQGERAKAMNLTDKDILLRLTAFEDSFVERKTASDSKDWLKSVVAFANSVPVGEPAILFIGVRNDGTIEGNTNLDSLQQTLSEKLAVAYPAIYYLPKVLEQAGRQFLAVIIPGSENRPHFAGQAYVRDGSKSVAASARQFETLVAERSSKVREISRWKGKKVTFHRSMMKDLGAVHVLGTTGGRLAGTIVDCNQFYVTAESVTRPGNRISFPLEIIDISFDHNNDCLELRIGM
jgi:Putative DNA-binding domain